GIRPVGVRDSFFNLGGDSLIAVSLCLNIEKAFHQSLPVSKFIHAPTIEKLATLLSRQDTSHTLSSVVAIQPIGSRLPLFCVPGITGSAFEFFPLSRCLSPDQPLFGLQITGLVGRETLGKIEEIAACYVHDMLLQQPKGPYCLAGYSFGCLVAYEVAQQLREMGREVGLLVFLDVPFCRAKKATLLLDVGVRRMIRRYGLRGLLVKASVEVVRKLRLLIKRSLPESVSRLGTGEALELARDAYKPKTYSGRVIFLQIRQNLDVPKIWESLITGGMEVHEVPGDHKTLLRGSSVQALAERLTECLKNLGH
ncbi:MAG: thioesterase domain-containing protein, partial [Planctomycetota bacterium]|nr:thioesterase domain-containing protein [Planctomycetota bacterium]